MTRAHEHLVAGVLKVGGVDGVFVVAGGPEGGFVDDIANVRTGESDGGFGQSMQIDIVVERDIAHVDFEDLLATFEGWPTYGDMPIESTGAKECGVEHIRAVGCGHNDDRLIG